MTGLTKNMENTIKRNVYELNCMQIPEGGICWQETRRICCAFQELLELCGTKLVTMHLGGKNVKVAGNTIDLYFKRVFNSTLDVNLGN